jgi:hypothetical protein
MRRLYAILLLLSLLTNVYLLSTMSEIQVGKVHKVIVKENNHGDQTKVSENTTMFVIDFIERIKRCDTFLWAVSENNKEIKYTIWFAKEKEF